MENLLNCLYFTSPVRMIFGVKINYSTVMFIASQKTCTCILVNLVLTETHRCLLVLVQFVFTMTYYK